MAVIIIRVLLFYQSPLFTYILPEIKIAHINLTMCKANRLLTHRRTIVSNLGNISDVHLKVDFILVGSGW